MYPDVGAHVLGSARLRAGLTYNGFALREERSSKFPVLKRLVVVLLALCVLLYAGDFVSLRLAIPRRDKLGTVTVHTLYAVKLKNGRTEYDDGGDQAVNCSNSLLPQMGASPCWYLVRHPERQVTIDSGNPNNPRVF